MIDNCRLSIKNLSFGYEERLLFEDINLDMDSGFISIIGPNGSGKTTLIKLITGLMPFNTGKVEIYGQDIKEITSNKKAKFFTVINQKQSFPFPFTCMELISLGRYPYRRDLNSLSKEDYNIIINAMKDTDVIKFKDKVITDISGGEQQRVVLASALAQDTQIVYLDEAFSALDICHKANMIKLLKDRIDKKNILVVAIMHDLNMAYRYSDKVCLIDKGKVLGFDKPSIVMTRDKISEVFNVNIDLIEGKGFFINI